MFTLKNEFLITKKGAFTLAEVLITLTILGLVAAITIPGIFHKNQERINKTRIKKAMANYEKLMSQVMIENDLKSNDMIDSFASNNSCINTRQYFKTVQDGDNNCQFKTADGLWWDISDLRSSTVAFKKNNLTDGSAEYLNSEKAFKFISGFQDSVFMVNSIEYLGSKSNFVRTANLLEYVFGKITQPLENYLKPCANSGKALSDLFSAGNNQYRHSCSAYSSENSLLYIFDNNGDLIARYDGCPNGNSLSNKNCTKIVYFKKINEKQNDWIGLAYNLSNGTYSFKNLYENGVGVATKKGCNTDGTGCTNCYNIQTKKYEPCQN